jgi:NhaP-type Na+/H+ or K+/H+ antiporter
VPTTRLGLWAVRLLATFAASFVAGISFVAVGEVIAGDEAFDSLWLTVPLMVAALTAVVAGVLAGVAAAFAIVRRRERSVLVFLPLLVLLFFAVFFVGELVGHE